MTTTDMTVREQTHRGQPLAWEVRGYTDATRTKRTPTHRADQPATVPAWTRRLLAAIGKDPADA